MIICYYRHSIKVRLSRVFSVRIMYQ